MLGIFSVGVLSSVGVFFCFCLLFVCLFFVKKKKHWIGVKMVHWSKSVTNSGLHDNNNILLERMG